MGAKMSLSTDKGAPAASKKNLYAFTEYGEALAACGGSWQAVKGLLGGKGAGLGRMTHIGLNVPYGFTITTEVGAPPRF